MFKRSLFLVLAALLVLLSACGAPNAASPTQAPAEANQPAATQPPAAPSTEAVTIRVALVDYVKDKTDKWLEEEVVPAFQKQYPNVQVEFVYLTWGTLDETIQGYFASNNGADIINLGSEYIAEYGDRLAPLNSYLKGWSDLEQYVPAALETVTWQDELRGLPWLTAPRAYMCRNDLLEKGGISAPPTTFADAIAQAGKTTVIADGKLTQAGIWTTGSLDDWQEYISLIWSLGGEIYQADGAPNFESDQAKAALQFMYDRRRAVFPNETTATLPEAQGSRLSTGEVACQWSNLWGAPATDDPLWSEISVVPGLTDPAFKGDTVMQTFTDWLAVPAYSKHIPEAVEFLKFLGNKENQHTYNEQIGSFPPRKDSWYGYVENPVMKNIGDLMLQHGRGFSDIRETAQFREVLMSEMPLYFTDKQDLETTLKNIQQKYTQVLEDAGRIG
jgi:multiple sugar transport system substrate-binding protein